MTAAIWAAALDWFRTIWPTLSKASTLFMAAMTGAKLQQGADAGDELQKHDVAARSASRVDIMSDGDVERELRMRGLY